MRGFESGTGILPVKKMGRKHAHDGRAAFWRAIGGVVCSLIVSASATNAAPDGPAGPAPTASAYEQIIGPIFEARCVACHGAKKHKGGLALHAWEEIAVGGDSGPVWVEGKPSESELVRRLQLPLDDEEHMPPSDEAQPAAEEIALIMRWIERGASPSATLADLELPATLATAAAELPAKLAALAPAAHDEPLWVYDSASVEKLREPLARKVAELQTRFPGALSYESRTSAALHFTAAGLGRDFGDEELAALAPLRDQLVSLDLSGTAITDRSAAVLGTFMKLRVFRAGFTSVGDAVASALAALPPLESLALHQTNVTESSIDAFSRLASLRALRLAGTAAESAGRAANLPLGPSAAELVPPEPPPQPPAAAQEQSK